MPKFLHFFSYSKHAHLKRDSSLLQRARFHFLLCPPHSHAARTLTLLLLAGGIFLALVALYPKQALPAKCRRLLQTQPNPTKLTILNATSFTSEISLNLTVRSSSTTGSEREVCKGGGLFALYVLWFACFLCGWAISAAPCLRAPPLLGMLLAGFVLRNAPAPFNVATHIPGGWSGTLRSAALLVILVRAGLGLDAARLRALSCLVLRLAFVPCLAEAVFNAALSHALLGLPAHTWGALLGFVLGAVSPAVVVPSMLRLQEARLGQVRAIPSLVIAAASIDDVLAITGFGVFFTVAFASSSLSSTSSISSPTSSVSMETNATVMQVLNISSLHSNSSEISATSSPAASHIALLVFKGPLEALAGIAFGICAGVLLWYLPSKVKPAAQKTHKKRGIFVFTSTLLLLVWSVVAMFGSELVHLPGAGALAVLTLSFVAANGWKSRRDWNCDNNPVLPTINTLWWLCQPFLFGLIGAGVDIKSISPTTIGHGLACMLLALCARILITFCVLFGSALTLKEKAFVALAWLPKATVQAAIGPAALTYAQQRLAEFQRESQSNSAGSSLRLAELNRQIAFSEIILAMAAISIIITAPIGAAIIHFSGPRLLEKSPVTQEEEEQSNESGHDEEQDDQKNESGTKKRRRRKKRLNCREITKSNPLDDRHSSSAEEQAKRESENNKRMTMREQHQQPMSAEMQDLTTVNCFHASDAQEDEQC